MQTYNLFVIKDNYVDNYSNNQYLFYLLKRLYNLKDNFNYGINLYQELCNFINVDALRYYLNIKYNLNNINNFYIDECLTVLKPTRIIIKSNCLPNLIKLFNCYNRNIFVCDFENNNYFWLDSFVKTKVLTYI